MNGKGKAMELRLKKIYRYGEENKMLYIALDVRYGWKGEMYNDIIKVNYNSIKRETYLTVKLKNPGVGTILERLVEYITTIDLQADSLKNPPLLVLEKLSDKFGLQYNEDEVKTVLEQQ